MKEREIHEYTYIHTYIHTYVHTYVHTYIHACIHTCVYNVARGLAQLKHPNTANAFRVQGLGFRAYFFTSHLGFRVCPSAKCAIKLTIVVVPQKLRWSPVVLGLAPLLAMLLYVQRRFAVSKKPKHHRETTRRLEIIGRPPRNRGQHTLPHPPAGFTGATTRLPTTYWRIDILAGSAETNVMILQ